eukprot:6203748-Pleurochrysis_carterae.AAC.7
MYISAIPLAQIELSHLGFRSVHHCTFKPYFQNAMYIHAMQICALSCIYGCMRVVYTSMLVSVQERALYRSNSISPDAQFSVRDGND